MTLHDLLSGIQSIRIIGDAHVAISDFHFDSRQVREGHLFVAIAGTSVDGHDFLEAAEAAGAAAIVCEKLPKQLAMSTSTERVGQATYVQVADSAAALATLAANFYGNPARRLHLTGITGTNGKTSTATLLHGLFQALGHPSGLISTVTVCIGDREIPATHTTPDPKQLHKAFADMVEAGCTHCFMEVSSHALVQQRVAGLDFQAAAFTNITHDHLDYHGTFAEYIKAKKRLFDGLSPKATAVINLDDRNARVMVQNCRAQVKTVALGTLSDYHGKVLENTLDGLRMDVDGHDVWFRLLGSFNAANLLLVYALACEILGENRKEDILTAMSALPGVNGRFQTVRGADGRLGIVDYAHTPDALEKILTTVRDIMDSRPGANLIVVAGCGGNRDAAKRPVMGKLAATLGDQAIFTSDNPRFEDPIAILQQMEAGIPADKRRAVLTIENRREAIRTACRLAHPGDVIVVAGKGHETYQEIQGVKHPFDDREVLREVLG
jgi:UDP-N-acetylmuramoyl-L-alanyl-D-glutamate--2,6-diaminopimelate ligase